MELAALPVAPAGGAAVLGAGGIATLLLWGVCLALMYVWKGTLGWLLLKLANGLYNVSIPVPGKNPRPLKGLANTLRGWSLDVEKALGHYAARCESAATYLFSQAGHLLEWTAREIADLAEATATAIGLVKIADLPKAIRAAVATTLAKLRTLQATIDRAQAQAIARVGHGLTGLERLAAHQWEILSRGIDRLEHIVTRTIPRSLATIRAQAKALGTRLGNQAKRIGRVEKLLGAAAMAAAVGVALRRLGLGWLRCSNVNRAGRAVCRMNPGILSELLLDVALLGISFNLVEFAKDVQSVTDETVEIIRNITD